MEFNKETGVACFNRIWKELDSLYHDIALRTGMSDSAFFIVFTIFELGNGCLQRDICDETFLSKQTVNSSIRNLENKGILYLESGKGRDMHIYLTEEGERFVEEKIKPVQVMEESAFSELTQEEALEMLRIMQKYSDIFRRKEQESCPD